MVKKISLALSAILTLSFGDNLNTNLNFHSKNVNKNSTAFNKKGVDEISILKEKIKKLEANQKQNQEDIDDLNDRVDNNEFQSGLNKIKWGASMEVTANNFSGKEYDQQEKRYIKFHNDNKWFSRIKLKMYYKLNEKTDFYGQLAVAKGWGDSTPTQQAYIDSEQGRALGTSNVYLERFYVNYKFTNHLIMTIGRQPSSDGPGMNLKYNIKRQATYPALLFNGSADGIVFTYDTKNKTNLKFRVAYGKGYQWDNPQRGWTVPNKAHLKDMDVYGEFIETKLPIEKMGNNLFLLSAVQGDNLVTNPMDDSGKQGNVNVGDYTHYGLYFENNKAFGTNFNYFVSAAIAHPDGNGKFMMDQYGNKWVLNDKNGYAYFAGIRYDFPKFKVGYEFNHGSKSWFSYSSNMADPLNKLATRGDVNDVYAIYPLDIYQFVRIGFTRADVNYLYSGYHIMPTSGIPKVNEHYENAYINYTIRF